MLGKARALLRDPLMRFLLAGALLFAGYEFVNRGKAAPDAVEPVHIGAGDIRWLEQTFANQWQRSPGESEMRDLVNALVEEELLAREAEALGLAKDDTIVRRRLAQKLTFMVDDTARIVEPTDAELKTFFAANADLFRSPATDLVRAALLQPGTAPERRTGRPRGARPRSPRTAPTPPSIGDPILLEREFRDLEAQSVSDVFGPDFAKAIFSQKPGVWAGPVKSGYGLHLVRVTDLDRAGRSRLRGGALEGSGGMAAPSGGRGEGGLSWQTPREVRRRHRRRHRADARG